MEFTLWKGNYATTVRVNWIELPIWGNIEEREREMLVSSNDDYALAGMIYSIYLWHA
jgi:hypothetical protein